MQTVKKPLESARETKPYRISIVPGSVYAGDGGFLRREIPFSGAKNESLQILRQEPRRFGQNPERVAVVGEILPRPPACQKASFDKQNAAPAWRTAWIWGVDALFSFSKVFRCEELDGVAHVHVYSREDIQQLCKASGLKLESYEVRKGFRLHCVVRKEADASL